MLDYLDLNETEPVITIKTKCQYQLLPELL